MSTSRARIPIIERQAITALGIEECLLDAGLHPVAVVSDVRDALGHRAENCVDLAIIDAHLDGGHDALTVACDLQGRLGVPTVFLTSHGRAGCHPKDEIVWVVKPFEDRELLRVVKKLLRARRLRLAVPVGP